MADPFDNRKYLENGEESCDPNRHKLNYHSIQPSSFTPDEQIGNFK